LVACEDESYHQILHQRRIALDACGHAHWRKCCYCYKYDDPVNMIPRGRGFNHKPCKNKYEMERRYNLIISQTGAS